MHTFFTKITAMITFLLFLLCLFLNWLGFDFCKSCPNPSDPSEPTTTVTEQVTEPSTTEPVTEPSTEATEPSTTEPVTEPSTEATEPSTTEPVTEPSTEATEPSTTEPVTEPSTEATEPSTTEPVTEPSIEATEPSTTEPVTEPSTEATEPSATEPVTEPSTEATEPSATEPVTEPSTEATEPSATEPVTEPSTEATEPSTTEPVTEEVATQGTTEEPTTSVEIGPQIRTITQTLFAPFGGTGNDIFNDIDNTSDGGYVACGTTSSTDEDLANVPDSSWIDGNYAFVVKYDKDGNVLWKQGIRSATRPYQLDGIAALDDGTIVAVGHIKTSGMYPDKETIIALAVKYSADGKLLWEKTFDGGYADIFSCISATGNGFVVGGKTESTDGDFEGVANLGGATAIVMNFDFDGNVLWKKYIAGNKGGSVEDIASDDYNNVFITCFTTSTEGNFGAFEGIGMGYIDTVVIKYNYNGDYMWNYVLASTARDEFGAIAADGEGGCVVAGSYELVNTYAPDGALAGIHNCGGIDALSIHLNSSGAKKWVNTIAGYDNDYINGITAVADGGYAVVGYTSSSDRDFADIGFSGEYDAFIGFITPGGSTVQIMGQGGSRDDRLNCAAYSPRGGVMALGQTGSQDGTFEGMNTHLSDIYIMLFGNAYTGYAVKYRVTISKY